MTESSFTPIKQINQIKLIQSTLDFLLQDHNHRYNGTFIIDRPSQWGKTYFLENLETHLLNNPIKVYPNNCSINVLPIYFDIKELSKPIIDKKRKKLRGTFTEKDCTLFKKILTKSLIHKSSEETNLGQLLESTYSISPSEWNFDKNSDIFASFEQLITKIVSYIKSSRLHFHSQKDRKVEKIILIFDEFNFPQKYIRKIRSDNLQKLKNQEAIQKSSSSISKHEKKASSLFRDFFSSHLGYVHDRIKVITSSCGTIKSSLKHATQDFYRIDKVLPPTETIGINKENLHSIFQRELSNLAKKIVNCDYPTTVNKTQFLDSLLKEYNLESKYEKIISKPQTQKKVKTSQEKRIKEIEGFIAELMELAYGGYCFRVPDVTKFNYLHNPKEDNSLNKVEMRIPNEYLLFSLKTVIQFFNSGGIFDPYIDNDREREYLIEDFRFVYALRTNWDYSKNEITIENKKDAVWDYYDRINNSNNKNNKKVELVDSLLSNGYISIKRVSFERVGLRNNGAWHHDGTKVVLGITNHSMKWKMELLQKGISERISSLYASHYKNGPLNTAEGWSDLIGKNYKRILKLMLQKKKYSTWFSRETKITEGRYQKLHEKIMNIIIVGIRSKDSLELISDSQWPFAKPVVYKDQNNNSITKSIRADYCVGINPNEANLTKRTIVMFELKVYKKSNGIRDMEENKDYKSVFDIKLYGNAIFIGLNIRNYFLAVGKNNKVGQEEIVNLDSKVGYLNLVKGDTVLTVCGSATYKISQNK